MCTILLILTILWVAIKGTIQGDQSSIEFLIKVGFGIAIFFVLGVIASMSP